MQTLQCVTCPLPWFMVVAGHAEEWMPSRLYIFLPETFLGLSILRAQNCGAFSLCRLCPFLQLLLAYVLSFVFLLNESSLPLSLRLLLGEALYHHSTRPLPPLSVVVAWSFPSEHAAPCSWWELAIPSSFHS